MYASCSGGVQELTVSHAQFIRPVPMGRWVAWQRIFATVAVRLATQLSDALATQLDADPGVEPIYLPHFVFKDAPLDPDIFTKDSIVHLIDYCQCTHS